LRFVGDALGDGKRVDLVARDLLGPALDGPQRAGQGRHACHERREDRRQRNVDLGGVARIPHAGKASAFDAALPSLARCGLTIHW
jgi:hypothetical protein